MKPWPRLQAIASTLLLSASAGANTYTVGSYNVENLWDADPDNTPAVWERFRENVLSEAERDLNLRGIEYLAFSRITSNYYDEGIIATKVSNLVTAISLAGSPDILGLQEFESAGNQSRAWEAPSSRGKTLKEELQALGYKHFFLGEQDEHNPVSVTPALISKVEVHTLPPIRVHDSYDSSARNIMVVEWRLPACRVVLINGHLKSKINGGHELRLRQAIAMRRRISEEYARDQSTRFIVLGDFNCGYHDEVMRDLGVFGKQPALFKDDLVPMLSNLWFELPEQDRWEVSYNGVNDALSHILISQNLRSASPLSYQEGSFHVVGHNDAASSTLLTAGGVPYAWQVELLENKTYKHLGQGFSDHLPLIATFRYTSAGH